MIRLRCTNIKCQKIFQLLVDSKEFVLCPYCGTTVVNQTLNQVKTSETNALFVSKLQMIEDEKKIEARTEKERKEELLIRNIMHGVMHACERNADKHIVEGFYGYDEDPAWANGPTGKGFVVSKRNEIPWYSYNIIEEYEYGCYDWQKVISLIKQEIQKLGFTKYNVEMIRKELVKQKQVGKKFWTGEPKFEKIGYVGYMLYIRVEW